jgi:hypothetical protein
MKRTIIDYKHQGRFEGDRGRLILAGIGIGDPLVAYWLDELAKKKASDVSVRFEVGAIKERV